ncbi:hypothetical protein BV20DRAFT_978505 [Pilatotrama ljubarskyi]|nr:hypothetical protein BV20DRAFT_978505 [Pilatotrama ljubarskyi]
MYLMAGTWMLQAIMRQILMHSKWSDVQPPVVNTIHHNPLIVNWVLSKVVDICITVVLCWYLWCEKTFVWQNMNRGAIAAIVQIFMLLTNLVWLAFHNVLSKCAMLHIVTPVPSYQQLTNVDRPVYANLMLATSNSCVALHGMMTSSELNSSNFSTQQTLPSI